ncbi:MAG: putative ABC transporter permease [Lachnospiraceae bacterium]|nr:putative ABC transporter permease [Lachnospiraceae bacterium]
MALAQYFTEFIFYSFLGWIWESIYCSIREKNWADRGFLFGPICPIYGCLVVGGSIVFKSVPLLSDPDFPKWAVFLICAAASAVTEYATSWVLEKRFHARWWDYNDMPLNINGRICVPATAGFGIAGVFVVRYLIPWISRVHEVIPGQVYELLSLVLAMILGADIALTEASLSTLLKKVEDMHSEFNEKAEQNYRRIAAVPKAIAAAPKMIASAPRVIAKAPKKLAAAPRFIASAPRKIASAPKVIGEKLQMLPYVGKLSGFQIHVLKKMKRFIPDRKRSEAQNNSRLAFWQNLKETAVEHTGRRRRSNEADIHK